MFLLFALLPLCAIAQTQPTNLSLSPATIYKPAGTPYCYTIYASNGSNMTVDVRYNGPNGTGLVIYGWPTLDASGTAYICVDSATVFEPEDEN